ncbi:MAG: hypothetical protein A2X13_02060 [Bacteroidetes bacterium GWC2_33_15]|nr:MAG: hypothetical protein A2X10_07565 [Bacteroidetes bacterium GWA2_33_15]OFX52263.1 MAG: hypothetical protein A2X13_02060 [Bacteroidetes bacterium GWC2_33_15]OFX64417.1 MAG: hypothetical protein A2X15_12880 [Bacteroidetes bacterium GWB2_32_14]OFX67822.1 MAG: hypothetical protein A2X14_06705 [Bacteroidetes bacterium GWD2_33_33]HAN19436.1 hypothetical protein [Bacteroidales bacterium]
MAGLLPQTIYEADINGKITYINQAGLNYFQYSEQEFNQGITLLSLVLEKELLILNIEKCLKGNLSGNQYTALRKNGEKFPVQVYSSAIIEEGSPVGLRGIIIDMTDRIKAEEALRESETKYKEMTLLLPQTVYESDIKGHVTYINKAGHETLGFTENDIKSGLSVFNVIVKEDHDRLKNAIAKIVGGESSRGNQYTAARKDGSTFPVQVYSSVIKKDGIPVGYRGIMFDITDRVKAEEEIKQSNELFKTLVDSNSNAITLIGLDGHYIMVNNAFANQIGLTKEKIIGKKTTDFDFYGNPDNNKKILDELFSKGYIGNHEITATRNGKTYNLLIYASIVDINNTKAILSSIVDITDRKKLENKLKESETLFKLMVDMVPYSIVISDSNNRYSFVNRAFLEKFQFELNDVLGKTPDELGFEVDNTSLQKYSKELRNKGKVLNLEFPILSPKKEKIYTLYSSQPIIIDDKPHIISSTVNITTQKLLENQLKEYNQRLEYIVKERTEELQTANEELQSTNEELYNQRENLELTLKKLKDAQEQLIQTEKMASLGILTAGVAHEINNPINYIYNGSMAIENYIKEKFPDHAESLKPLFNAINTGIARTTNIIKSLNNYSRTNENTNSECNIHDIIDNCLTMLFNQYKNRIQIFKKYAKDLPQFKANESTLHQLFINVLTNAIQAIEGEGKISIKTSITNNNIEIHITDTGKGISTENLKHIYDPFFTTKDPGKGTGLGLSIVQRIIQEHKGTIQCKSQLNKGTEIIVYLPINM